ncbi:hypothetical protein KUTeg_022828 [Tegillarca granosa]|uniref:Uncharacterized protein n=1 Tax=Tegillarca granosa TaxID=220873 RepID=A0ABQ9E659_TEGGR|nr:hypothetical protein KUTeg_022828 [Tegillarca granosa]
MSHVIPLQKIHLKMANEIVDIEEVVKNHAWNAFKKTATKSNLKYEEVGMKVIWDRVTFEPSEPEYSAPRHLKHPSTNVIFESTFHNTTDKEQEHSLKAERTTTVMSTTNVSKGYTTGGNIGLSLAVPGDVFKATASFGRQVKLEKASGNTNEKILTWSTDDTIKVKPRSKLTAKVEIKEEEFNSNFKIDVVDAGIVEIFKTNKIVDLNIQIQYFNVALHLNYISSFYVQFFTDMFKLILLLLTKQILINYYYYSFFLTVSLEERSPCSS